MALSSLASRTGGKRHSLPAQHPTSLFKPTQPSNHLSSHPSSYKLAAIKLVTPSQEHLETHYADLKEKPFFKGLVTYMGSGPICAMVWEGRDAVKTGRVLLGATNPLASAPGTIRGDFAIVSTLTPQRTRDNDGVQDMKEKQAKTRKCRMSVATSATAPTLSRMPRRRLTSGSRRTRSSRGSRWLSTGSTYVFLLEERASNSLLRYHTGEGLDVV